MRSRRGYPRGFADRLVQVMDLRDKNTSQLAKLTRVDRKTIYCYRQGDTSPSAVILARMCEILDVSADWLLFGKGEAPQ